MGANRISPENAVVIVLGAHVFRNHLSGTLQNRVQKAAEYLLAHPDAKCITTGGQGYNEPCAEGDAAREALIRLGIAPERIFAETRSVNTAENLRFAREILLREDLGLRVKIATQRFHQWRAGQMARQLGMEPEPLIAADRPGTRLKLVPREGLAILKYLLFTRKTLK